jgi:uncharacterized protein (TIGR00725 family)
MVGYVAVIGPGDEATPSDLADAERAGERLAAAGVVVVTGGLGGVMAAAARGAQRAGGTSVGLLPGADRAAGDPAHTIVLPTGLDELRNGLVVRAAQVVLAIGGSWGTLSEVALAMRTGTPVVALRGWELPEEGVRHLGTIDDAVNAVLALLDVAPT